MARVLLSCLGLGLTAAALPTSGLLPVAVASAMAGGITGILATDLLCQRVLSAA